MYQYEQITDQRPIEPVLLSQQLLYSTQSTKVIAATLYSGLARFPRVPSSFETIGHSNYLVDSALEGELQAGRRGTGDDRGVTYRVYVRIVGCPHAHQQCPLHKLGCLSLR